MPSDSLIGYVSGALGTVFGFGAAWATFKTCTETKIDEMAKRLEAMEKHEMHRKLDTLTLTAENNAQRCLDNETRRAEDHRTLNELRYALAAKGIVVKSGTGVD